MNLLKTVAAISSMTMLSRITGLLRESLFARAFGASAYTDAFIIAYRIPNLLRRLFAEGAFSQAFVPILAEYKTQHGDQATKGLVDHVANSLIWATLVVTILGIVGSAGLLTLIASGLAPEAFDDAVLMTRIMFPYIMCMSMAALAGGILNTWREFKIPAFAPVLLNVSQILAALFLVKYFAQPVYAMVVGVCVGGILQVAIQVPALIKIGMLPKLSFNPLSGLHDAGVRRMLARMGPAVFAVAAAQISLLINTSIAASLAAGSVSALQYADRLMEFPIGLLGVALGTVLLPSLSKANAEGDATEYSSLLDWGLRLTFLLAMPAAVGMAVLAEPLIATLFNYGKFTAAAVHASSLPLTAYAAGLLGIILVKTLAPAFYATQNVRTPVRIAMVVIVATQLLNGVFVFGMGMGVTGLALSIGVGACLNAFLLFLGLRKRGIYKAQPGWALFFLKLVIASCALGAVAWFAQNHFDWPALRAVPFQRAGILFAIIGAAAVAYFAVLGVLGFRLKHFKRRAR